MSSQAIGVLIQRSTKTFDVPGIAIGIIKDGQVIYARGHSVRSLNSGHLTLAPEGKAPGFTMLAISPLTDFSYDFHDLDFHRVK